MGANNRTLETAQCIWEAVLNIVYQTEIGKANPVARALRYRGRVYVRAAMRQKYVIEAAQAGWDTLPGERQAMLAPFDWVYIPFFVEHCINWDAFYDEISVKPGWQGIIFNATTLKE